MSLQSENDQLRKDNTFLLQRLAWFSDRYEKLYKEVERLRHKKEVGR